MDKSELEKMILEIKDDTSRQKAIDTVFDKITFYRDEAKKAFASRDSAKTALREIKEKFEKASSKDLVTQKKLESLLVKEASRNRAMNPSYVYKLLKDDFTYDPASETFKDKSGLSVSDRIKSFSESEENDFLFETSAKSGTGHLRSYVSPWTTTSKKLKVSREDEQKAEELGVSIEDYKEIELLKNKKLRGK